MSPQRPVTVSLNTTLKMLESLEKAGHYKYLCQIRCGHEDCKRLREMVNTERTLDSGYLACLRNVDFA